MDFDVADLTPEEIAALFDDEIGEDQRNLDVADLTPEQLDILFEEDESEPQVGGNIEDHVNIGLEFQQRVNRFNTEGAAFNVRFHNLENVANLNAFLIEAIQHAFDHMMRRAADQDRVGLLIRHPGLDHPILIPFRRRDQLDAETILRYMEEVQQSNTTFQLDDEMAWQVTRIAVPDGSGDDDDDDEEFVRPRKMFRGNLDELYAVKAGGHGGCIIRISNTDDLCLTRALVTARSRLHKDDSPEG